MSGSSSGCPKRKREDVVVFSPTAATDRISQLPRPILHHILSFLSTMDVVRIGSLSKTWYQTYTSFPISDFCQSLVGHLSGGRGGITREEQIHIFVDFVRKSLQRQCLIYGIIPKFKLSMIPHSSIEDCIQLAIQNDVKELEMDLTTIRDRIIMPQALLSAAKGLIFLSLSGCHLSVPPVHSVPTTWPFLRNLCLYDCHVEGLNFQTLTLSCPLLESLSLRYCDGLRDISLSCLTKLTELDIARSSTDTHDIMVELDVPCLKSFALYTVRGRCNVVDLTACKNITILKWNHFPPMLSSRDLTKLIAGLPALESLDLFWGSDWSHGLNNSEVTVNHLLETDLSDLVAGLPGLKSLSLHCKCERIRFSSQRLEKLQLSADEVTETDLTDLIAGLPSLKFLLLKCKLKSINFSSQQLEELHLFVSELVKVRIGAPSLKTFRYSKDVLPSDFFMERSSPQEVTIDFVYASSSSFLKLRKFLGGFKKVKLLQLCLSRHNRHSNRLLPEELMVIPVPVLPDIKHLRILGVVDITGFPEIASGGYAAFLNGIRGEYVAVLNGLLCSCRPGSISVNFMSHNKSMIEAFCEELSEMVRRQHYCTDGDHIQCGCHGRLRSFRIKQSDECADAKFISCDVLLALRPTRYSKEIVFMLEW